MLKFNIKEHKLEELEKYGFVKKFHCYSINIEDISYNDTHPSYTEKRTFITISTNTMQVLFMYSYKLKDTKQSKRNIISNGICEYETNLELLYDLIKDGLVIKE